MELDLVLSSLCPRVQWGPLELASPQGGAGPHGLAAHQGAAGPRGEGALWAPSLSLQSGAYNGSCTALVALLSVVGGCGVAAGF